MVDVIIVGSGASGIVAANKLVNEGYSVLMIENGQKLNTIDDYFSITDKSQKAYTKKNSKLILNGNPWTTTNLGGGSVFFGGVSFRYREIDFDASKYIKSDLDCKFPYDYKELEKYYDIIEDEIGIARCVNDPLSPSSKKPIMNPHDFSVGGKIIYDLAKAKGLNPFYTPLAINTVRYNNRNKCENSSECIGKQCLQGAKNDSYTVYFEDLLKKQNFKIITDCIVVRIIQNNSFKVSAIEYIDLKEKRKKKISSRIIILASNAIQSAAILLKSKSKFSPNGIGNKFDMVGRGLSFKLSSYTSSIVKYSEKVINKGPFSTISLMDYYMDNNCPTGLGGLIYEAKNAFTPALNSNELQLRLECILSDHPSFKNRVILSNVKDIYGEPILLLDYKTHPIDNKRLTYMKNKCLDILNQKNNIKTFHEDSFYYLGSGHLHGTCRAGTEPKNYVLDKYCRVHGIDNLFVVDGSFMPYSGGVNPTFTIQANSLRTSSFIAQNYKTRYL